jgi:hypothetical protein
MKVYLINIILTLVVGMLVPNYNIRRMFGEEKYRTRKFYWLNIVVIGALWIVIYALRYGVGTDFFTYYNKFANIGDMSLKSYVESQRDYLFASLEWVSHKVFRGNWIAYSVILGGLVYGPVLITLRKKSANFVISAMLYIFTLQFYSAFNGIRQAIAVSLLFMAHYLFLKEKKYRKYIVTCAIAYGFHSSAIFIIPFHIVSLKNLKSRAVKVTSAFIVFSYMFMWQLWAYLIEFLEIIGQTKMAEDYADATMNGSSYLRFFVYLLPALVGIFFYRTLKRRYEDIDSDLILTLFSALFMLASTKYWLFARIATYLGMSSILLIPRFDSIFTDGSKKMGKLLIGILYFLYMLVVLLSGEGNYVPYNFI